jgi:uncharacterized protein YjlB
MSLLEDVKRITEKATGWKRPDDPEALLRERKPQAYRFKDDGLNHPKWPLVIYKSAVRLPEALDPAAVFEDLFASNGWGDSWRDSIYDYAHYHSRIHEVVGIARGTGKVQFGGPKGRILLLKAGDVAILPAGTDTNAGKRAMIFWWSELIRPPVRSMSAPRRKTAKKRWPRFPRSRSRVRRVRRISRKPARSASRQAFGARTPHSSNTDRQSQSKESVSRGPQEEIVAS